MSKTEITWWGASSVEIAVGDERLVIDPFLEPGDARFGTVCVTREDHDHCHEPTLRRLVVGDAFERLIAPEACTVRSQLDAPIPDDSADLDFVGSDALVVMRAKVTRSPGPGPGAGAGAPEIDAGSFHVEGVDSSDREPVTILDRWQRYRAGDLSWPHPIGTFVGMGQLAPLGYIVTHRESGARLYHPGDLQEVFDGHLTLRGTIDCLFLPLVSASGIEVSLVDAVRPRYVVPIQYRPPTQAPVADGDLSCVDLETGLPLPGADPAGYRDEIRALIARDWYPSPAAPAERIAELTSLLDGLDAEVVTLEHGAPWELRPR